MGSDAPRAPTAVRYRPHVWMALGFWAMSPFFFLMAFGYTLIDPTVDIACRRQEGRPRCEVVTEGLLGPSVVRLSDTDLQGATLALVPEPHERSYRKVELRQGPSARELAGFSPSARRRAVDDVNDFLDDPSSGQIDARLAARLVDPGRPWWQRYGLFPFQLIGLLCLAGGVYSLGRQTTVSRVGDEIEVRRSRWPWPADVRHWRVQDLAGVEAVSRIPKELAPFVASLPWRNIYRASALAFRMADGEEVLSTDLCKRGRALHERLAATIRTWLPPRA